MCARARVCLRAWVGGWVYACEREREGGAGEGRRRDGECLREPSLVTGTINISHHSLRTAMQT